MANLAEVLGNALSLEVRDRAALAERLLVSCPTNRWYYDENSVMLVHVQNKPDGDPCRC